jgi:DNA processing protein
VAEGELLVEEPGARACRVVARSDRGYPWLLAQIYHPPARVFLEGCRRLSGLHVAVVGSCHPAPARATLGFRLGYQLARAGAVVVGGLFPGIAAIAHRGAMAAGGSSLAVLAWGLGWQVPARLRQLRDELPRRGMVLSEYPAQTPPSLGNYRASARVIAGLCHGMVIVDGRWPGDELLAADFALEEGREVLAVPGEPGCPQGALPGKLLYYGAVPALSGRQVLAAVRDAGWEPV